MHEAPYRQIQDGFLHQARRCPETPAIVEGRRTVTYGDLLAQAVRLACVIEAAAAPSHRPVAIVGDKRIEFVVAMIATLLTGRAFTALNPAQRSARLAQMVAALRPSLLVDMGSAAEDYDPVLIGGSGPFIRYPSSLPERALVPRARPAGAAYCLFTSGSTGVPRGVIVGHGAAVAAQSSLVTDVGLSAHDRVCNEVALCFDVSTFDVFATFAVGGTVDLTPEHILTDPRAFLAHLEVARITSLFTVPTVAVELLQADPRAVARLSSLRRLMLTGELISQKLARLLTPLMRAGVRVHNQYGATEFPFGLSRQLTFEDMDQPNVLDASAVGRAATVSVGPFGGVEVSGPGVMSGYVCPETDFAAPFQPLARFGSGDVAEWLPEGHLRLVGRRDRQVRHLGHRVELAEIEAALEQHPSIQMASVCYDAERMEFAAHVSLNGGDNWFSVDNEAVGVFLHRRLPDYMLPHHIRPLRAMPRTATGKKDYVTLREAQLAL